MSDLRPFVFQQLAIDFGRHNSTAYMHCSRVAYVSRMLLPGEYGGVYLSYNNAYVAGFLHDVGKIKIPNELLEKAAGLSEEEIELMRQHPRQGVELVKEASKEEWMILSCT